jgi:hypothetical protein
LINIHTRSNRSGTLGVRPPGRPAEIRHKHVTSPALSGVARGRVGHLIFAAPPTEIASVVLRTFSVPERLGGFGLLAGAAALAWPTFTERTGAGLPCPLRTLTGVPCPACGLTTAAVALVRGEFAAAWHANPLIFGLAVLAIAVVPLVVLRATGVLAGPRPWSPGRRQRVGWLAGLLAVASWLFQVHRLGLGRAL